jgi:hypothetical protein
LGTRAFKRPRRSYAPRQHFRCARTQTKAAATTRNRHKRTGLENGMPETLLNYSM